MIFERGKWLVQFIEEWSQFLGSCNWYTFHPIQWEWEDERCMGAYEFTPIFMGIGIRVRWNHTKTEYVEEIERMVKDLSDDR